MTMESLDSLASQLGNQFDSDSSSLMIDDGASVCITNSLEDFAQLPQKVICKVKGIEGHAKATH